MDKGAVSNNSLTKSACRRNLGTTAYTQPAKFDVQFKYIKAFLFDCLGGSNTDNYLTSMKEVSVYIRRKFDHCADIYHSLENNMQDKISVP